MHNPFKEWHLSIWHHPHHYAASIVSKLAVNSATVIWAVHVLLDPKAMSSGRFSYYTLMLEYLSPSAWACLATVLSFIGIYRLWAKSPPIWIGGIGYAVLMLFWSYIAIAVNFLTPRPVPPAGAAAIAIVAVLSVYAFVANPRTHNGDST
jgi:hypothetical protein